MTEPPTKAEIRPVGPWAAELLAEIHKQCFDDAWPEQAMATLLGMPGVAALVAAMDDQPAGFAIGRSAADEGEVLTIAIRPEWRRRGIGGDLLSALITQVLRSQGAQSVFLEVSAANHPAMALYGRAGFTEVGRRTRYYAGSGNGTDALILRRTAET